MTFDKPLFILRPQPSPPAARDVLEAPTEDQLDAGSLAGAADVEAAAAAAGAVLQHDKENARTARPGYRGAGASTGGPAAVTRRARSSAAAMPKVRGVGARIFCCGVVLFSCGLTR